MLILTGLLGIIYVVESIYFGKVLDATITTMTNVKRTIFTIIIITLSEYIFGVITTFTISRSSEIGIYNLRSSLAKKICTLKYSVFTQKSVGDILSRTMGDLNGISAFWTGHFIDMYRGIFTFATGFAVCVLISVKLTIVGFIFIPIFYYAAYKSSVIIERTTYKSRKSIGFMNSLAHNILSGIITLKSFNLENIMKNKYELEEEKSHLVKHIDFSEDEIISIKDLSFYYEDTKILDNINLSLKRGRKIAIVGDSGAGKSTLINILSGMYLPNDGQVFIKGIKLNEENIPTIRNEISIVS